MTLIKKKIYITNRYLILNSKIYIGMILGEIRLIDFNEMSKREYDELGFLYEQRYGPYKPFKEGIIVDGGINPYIRQLMDIVCETEVDRININTVERFLFSSISREESRKILSLLLRCHVISEQGILLMNYEEYSIFINEVLNEVRLKMDNLKQEGFKKEEDKTMDFQKDKITKYKIQTEDEIPEIETNRVTIYLFLYIVLIGVSLFLCTITYRVLGIAFMIPAFIITLAYLYKYTK